MEPITSKEKNLNFKNLMTKELDEIFKNVKKSVPKKVDDPQEVKQPLKKKLPDDGFADSRGKSKFMG